MPWAVISMILKDLLTKFFSAAVADLVDRLMPKTGAAPVARTPSELRHSIVTAMLEAANAGPYSRMLQAVVLSVAVRLAGPVIWALWDELHTRGLVPVKASQVSDTETISLGMENYLDQLTIAAIDLMDNPPQLPVADFYESEIAIPPVEDDDTGEYQSPSVAPV